jgi:hypothetical protein
VHFVNKLGVRRPPLTLRTYTVRFVNGAPARLDLLTKCTLTAPRPRRLP